jgi:hypothetical protein
MDARISPGLDAAGGVAPTRNCAATFASSSRLAIAADTSAICAPHHFNALLGARRA